MEDSGGARALSFNDLPRELVAVILHFVGQHPLKRSVCVRVCRKWSTLVTINKRTNPCFQSLVHEQGTCHHRRCQGLSWQSVVGAALKGHNRLVWWVVHSPDGHRGALGVPDENDCLSAIAHGQWHLADTMRAYGARWKTMKAVMAALRHGYTQALAQSVRDKSVDVAAEGLSVHLAIRGSLSQLVWAHARGAALSPAIVYLALRSQDRDTIRWAYERMPVRSDRTIVDALVVTEAYDCAQWIVASLVRDSSLSVIVTTAMLASSGDLDGLRLFAQDLGAMALVPWSYVMRNALWHGHSRVVMWIVEAFGFERDLCYVVGRLPRHSGFAHMDKAVALLEWVATVRNYPVSANDLVSMAVMMQHPDFDQGLMERLRAIGIAWPELDNVIHCLGTYSSLGWALANGIPVSPGIYHRIARSMHHCAAVKRRRRLLDAMEKVLQSARCAWLERDSIVMVKYGNTKQLVRLITLYGVPWDYEACLAEARDMASRGSARHQRFVIWASTYVG